MADFREKEKPGMTPWPAIILCGGRSRRMGRDKAFLPLGSQSILHRVERVFSEMSNRLVLVVGHDATVSSYPGFAEVLKDTRPDFGPLEGLRVGLQQVMADNEVVLVGTCDAPMVVPEVYHYMIDRLLESQHIDVVMPFVHERHHPLTAVYRTRVFDAVHSMVESGQPRVRDLLARIRVQEVEEQELRTLDPGLFTIRNINTQEDYERLLRETR